MRLFPNDLKLFPRAFYQSMHLRILLPTDRVLLYCGLLLMGFLVLSLLPTVRNDVNNGCGVCKPGPARLIRLVQVTVSRKLRDSVGPVWRSAFQGALIIPSLLILLPAITTYSFTWSAEYQFTLSISIVPCLSEGFYP